MMIKIIFLFCQFAILCSHTCAKIEGHYWRDYVGITPIDALPAGMDTSGKPTYVGQTIKGNMIIPGILYLNSPFVYYEHEGANYRRSFVKILCTKSPNDFVWVRNNNNEEYPDDLVIGGFEGYHFSYIGRVFYNLETVIGKVNQHKLYAVSFRDFGKSFNAFEILTYKPKNV